MASSSSGSARDGGPPTPPPPPQWARPQSAVNEPPANSPQPNRHPAPGVANLPGHLNLPDTGAAPEPSRSRPTDQRGGPRKLRLGEVLVAAGVCDEAAIKRALAVQKMGGGRLGSILVNLRLCTEAQIRVALSTQLGVEVVELSSFDPEKAVLQALPREMIRKYEAIPIRQEAGALHIVMKDPYNLTAIDDIRFHTGCRIVVNTCTESEFAAFLEEHLESQSLIDEIISGGTFYERAIETVDAGLEDDETNQVLHELKIAGEQPPIITMCNFLLVESINRRASDIHIEPYESYFRVRLRVDGALQTLLTPPQRLHSPMITRLKIMAEMDIAKRRCPQDGHIAITYQGEVCHYRVSTLPTVYGEKCVVRLLKREGGLESVDKLGFDPKDLKEFKRALAMPQGIILVTGPTGSGKTTTLHAGLGHINEPDINIVTLEDPVEASIPGINHVQINEAAGVSFSSGLRSILRQDPDVVFVGEMRDEEVSAIAIKSALTGHLVLSSLHTNSAAESLIRLSDLGIPNYLLANALVTIIAQRLLRRVCDVCAEPDYPSPQDCEDFRIDAQQLATATLRKGAGCKMCQGTGYRGRLAVYELLTVTGEMRELIRRQAHTEELIANARARGMRLLYESGVEKALQGLTTLKEVRRRLSDSH